MTLISRTLRFLLPSDSRKRSVKRRSISARKRLAIIESLESRSLLAAYVVNTLTDGPVGPTDGLVSLREAITAANSNAAAGDAVAGAPNSQVESSFGDTITFAPGLTGVITLTQGQLPVTGTLGINGGNSSITINGGGANRIFDITAANSRIASLTLTGGSADVGGAIRIASPNSSTLSQLVVQGNTATGQGGGGIAVISGNVTIRNSNITNNTAGGASGSGGGLLFVDGTTTIVSTQIDGNKANRAGGGIEAVNGRLGVYGGTLVNNIAGPAGSANPGNGGAIHVTAAASTVISGATVTDNTAAAEGGGLWNSATGTMSIVKNTVIAQNVASGVGPDQGGGGVFNDGGTLSIRDSSIAENRANGTNGSGGGLLSLAGSVTVVSTPVTFNIANRAGGGIEVVEGTVNLVNSNLINNVAGPTGSAAPGNGGGLHVSGAAAKVSLTGGSVFGNNAAREGGGLWNQAGSTMTVQGGTLISSNTASGPAADDGGGGIFNNGGVVRLTGIEISDNFADGTLGSGGGVFSIAGQVTIVSSKIDGNNANRAGGGIEVVAGSVDVFGGSLSLNVAGPAGAAAPGNGGGAHVTGGASSSFSGTLIADNRAALQGGGLWNSSTGSMSLINNATIVNNTASGVTALADGGGGIFNNGGELQLVGAQVLNNIADGTAGSGGGIMSIAGPVTIVSTLINGNTANRAGGGIEVVAGAVNVYGGALSFNVAGPTGFAAPGNGGGLHVSAAASTMFSGATISGNTAALEGGGLWNSATGTMTVQGNTIVSDNIAKGNAADDGGGGIFNNGGALRLTDAQVFNNVASGTAGSGGGILSLAGPVTVVTSRIDGNTANRAGGGIEVVVGAVKTFGGSLSNNIAGPFGSASPGNGGGLHVSGAATTLFSSTTISANTAALEGGGLWNSSTGSMAVLNASFVSANVAHGNAADDGGGGIFNNGGSLRLESVEISDNVADGTAGSGGGILSLAGSVTVVSSQIKANIANRAGGGIEIVNGSLGMYGGTIDNNVAGPAGSASPGNGGGLHVSAAAATAFAGTSITNNRAAAEGGGLWNSATGSLMVIRNSLISGNIASGAASDQGGGGIYNDGGSLSVSTTTIQGNLANGASGSGGGVLSLTGAVTVVSSQIANNVANRAGGGIEVVSGKVAIYGGTLVGNIAGPLGTAAPGNGGGLHVTSDAKTLFVGVGVTGNDAAAEGGGLWNSTTGSMAITGSSVIANNRASGVLNTQGGGGVFNRGGAVLIMQSTVSGNIADGTAGSGGGVMSLAGQVAIIQSDISGNVANRAGGGVEIVVGTLNLTDSTLARNVAGPAGAAAPGNGGGLHVSGNTATSRLLRTIVFNNIANNEGGGLWNQVGSTLTVTDSQISRNRTVLATGRGGGVFDNGGTTQLFGSSVSSNASGGDGGGLHFNTNSTGRIDRTTVDRNTAVNRGGGVFSNAAVDVVFSDIAKNTSGAGATGGGIFGDAAAVTTLTSSTVTSNTPNNTAGTGVFA